jgi:hypothetical protein
MFDNLDIPVALGTHLSYWVYHLSSSAASQHMGLDLIFSDGSALREYNLVVDNQGVRMHPSFRNETPNQWVPVDADLSTLAGKHIQQILVAYDDAADSEIGQFRSYFDDIAITSPSPLESSIIADTIPTQIVSGHTYDATVTVRNDGSSTWSEATLFRLGAVGDGDPFAGGRQYLQNGETVALGQTHVFHIAMTTPWSPGTYTTDWQMVQDMVAWFGATLTKTVTVASPPPYEASVVSDTIPTTMEAGHTYSVSITVRNEGANTWSEAEMYRLGAVNDSDPFAGGRQYLSAGDTVSPGQTHTFTFVMTAPMTAGSYVTDWRMVRDMYTWYGATLTKSVQVIPPSAWQFNHNPDNRLDSIQLSPSSVIQYQYDANGNMTRRMK